MASVPVIVGGAALNAVASPGGNTLLSLGSEKEHEECTKAEEKLQADREGYARKRAEMLDWINEELRRQSHAQQNFKSIDDAMEKYLELFGMQQQQETLEKEAVLSGYYTPSDELKTNEMIAVAIGLTITMFLACKIGKRMK